ncbi:MAG: hypothetical protein ACXVCP_07660 [Bdellovibrio sp.]
MLVLKNYALAFLLLLLCSENLVFAKTQSPAKISRNKKPACEADTVTRNCDFFRERSSQASITIPDGGIIPNPLHLVQKKDTSQVQSKNEKNKAINFDYDQMLYGQAEIIEALENAGISTRFKVAYASYAVAMTMNPQKTIELPWPPDEKNAPKKAVKPDEVEAYIKEKLSENEYSHLQSLVKAQAIPVRARWEEQQQAKQKAMELNKKAQEEQSLKTAAYTKKQDRIKELFKYSKENIIAVIRRGKSDSNLTQAE